MGVCHSIITIPAFLFTEEQTEKPNLHRIPLLNLFRLLQETCSWYKFQIPKSNRYYFERNSEIQLKARDGCKNTKASRLFHCYIAENRYIRSCPKKAGCYASSIVSKLSKKPFSQWQATLCTLWNHTLCRWKSVWRTWTITTQCITSYTINNETFYIFGCSTTLTQCIKFSSKESTQITLELVV